MENKERLIERAKAYYLGRGGYEKSNCAQAVANTFVKELQLNDVDLGVFGGLGGGRAPTGECGALYAAKVVLGKAGRQDKIKELETRFRNDAGSLSCREIRGSRKLPCVGCVEKCAAFLCDNL